MQERAGEVKNVRKEQGKTKINEGIRFERNRKITKDKKTLWIRKICLCLFECYGAPFFLCLMQRCTKYRRVTTRWDEPVYSVVDETVREACKHIRSKRELHERDWYALLLCSAAPRAWVKFDYQWEWYLAVQVQPSHVAAGLRKGSRLKWHGEEADIT
jgi:hypothetical protein